MTTESNSSFDVEVFYDGDCPLCTREINMLRGWDRRSRIRFTNLADPNFHPDSIGKSYDEMMAQIYGRLPDGQIIRGVEVFRRLYAAVGYGPLVKISRLPIISQMLDLSYKLFARNRLRLTGRCKANSCSVDNSESK